MPRRKAGRRANPRPANPRPAIRRPAIRRPAHGLTFDDFRRAAAAFPAVEDSTSYGTPALKVRGKLLARLHQSGECVVLRADLVDREILLQSDPTVFFITEHYRDHPWILVRLSTIDAAALPDLLDRAWRLVAPKSLVARHEGQGGAHS